MLSRIEINQIMSSILFCPTVAVEQNNVLVTDIITVIVIL